MWGNILGTLFWIFCLFMLWVSWHGMTHGFRKRYVLPTAIVNVLITGGVIFVLNDIWSSNA